MKLGEIAKIAKGDYWIIPRYLEWVTKGRSLTAERDALVKIMTRPKRVRTNTFSASGAGQCLRRRQLSYLGVKQTAPSEGTMNIFANGDYVHLRMQVAGIVGGWLQAAEVAVTQPSMMLTGTMDGWLTNGAGAEFKSINSRGFTEVSSFGPKADHVEQTHSYMIASGIDRFHVLYENKDTQALKEFVVDRDPKIEKKVLNDLQELQAATNAKALLPMLGECVEGRGAITRCPFAETCPKATFAPSESRKRSIRVARSTATGWSE